MRSITLCGFVKISIAIGNYGDRCIIPQLRLLWNYGASSLNTPITPCWAPSKPPKFRFPIRKCSSVVLGAGDVIRVWKERFGRGFGGVDFRRFAPFADMPRFNDGMVRFNDKNRLKDTLNLVQ